MDKDLETFLKLQLILGIILFVLLLAKVVLAVMAVLS